MPGFLVTYNRKTGHCVIVEYSDSADAMHERARLDMENHQTDVEHVVLVADSLGDIRVTHSRYFLRHKPEVHAASAGQGWSRVPGLRNI